VKNRVSKTKCTRERHFSEINGKTPAVEGWGFVASEGFEPPKSETADLQLSDVTCPVSLRGTVPSISLVKLLLAD
jgi:hypothetical protein